MKASWEILLISVFFLLSFGFVKAAQGPVFFSEIAWMGTEKNSADEWIELYNNSNQKIDLNGWAIYEEGGKTLIEPLKGEVLPYSFYLIERSDENTLPAIRASQKPTTWGGNGLNNKGEDLVLLNNKGKIVDRVNCQDGWFAGNNKTKQTMERKDFKKPGSDPNAWQTSKKPGGTPKQKNSQGEQKPKQTKPDKGEGAIPPKKFLSSQKQSQARISPPRFNSINPLIRKQPDSLRIKKIISVLVALLIAIGSTVLVFWLKNYHPNP